MTVKDLLTEMESLDPQILKILILKTRAFNNNLELKIDADLNIKDIIKPSKKDWLNFYFLIIHIKSYSVWRCDEKCHPIKINELFPLFSIDIFFNSPRELFRFVLKIVGNNFLDIICNTQRNISNSNIIMSSKPNKQIHKTHCCDCNSKHNPANNVWKCCNETHLKIPPQSSKKYQLGSERKAASIGLALERLTNKTNQPICSTCNQKVETEESNDTPCQVFIDDQGHDLDKVEAITVRNSSGKERLYTARDINIHHTSKDPSLEPNKICHENPSKKTSNIKLIQIDKNEKCGTMTLTTRILGQELNGMDTLLSVLNRRLQDGDKSKCMTLSMKAEHKVRQAETDSCNMSCEEQDPCVTVSSQMEAKWETGVRTGIENCNQMYYDKPKNNITSQIRNSTSHYKNLSPQQLPSVNDLLCSEISNVYDKANQTDKFIFIETDSGRIIVSPVTTFHNMSYPIRPDSVRSIRQTEKAQQINSYKVAPYHSNIVRHTEKDPPINTYKMAPYHSDIIRQTEVGPSFNSYKMAHYHNSRHEDPNQRMSSAYKKSIQQSPYAPGIDSQRHSRPKSSHNVEHHSQYLSGNQDHYQIQSVHSVTGNSVKNEGNDGSAYERQPEYSSSRESKRQPEYSSPRESERQPEYSSPRESERQPEYSSTREFERQPEYSSPRESEQNKYEEPPDASNDFRPRFNFTLLYKHTNTAEESSESSNTYRQHIEQRLSNNLYGINVINKENKLSYMNNLSRYSNNDHFNNYGNGGNCYLKEDDNPEYEIEETYHGDLT